jgi:nitrile hydratase accessory protein
VTDAVVPLAGSAAPPRLNGELVFAAPWESRSFGIALSLHEGGVIDFEEFRAQLIDEIAAWQSEHAGSAEGWMYYERWQAALERALVDRGTVTQREIDDRAASIAEEQSHDHDH